MNALLMDLMDNHHELAGVSAPVMEKFLGVIIQEVYAIARADQEHVAQHGQAEAWAVDHIIQVIQEHFGVQEHHE